MSSHSINSCFSEVDINEIYSAPSNKRQERTKEKVYSAIQMYEMKGVVYICLGIVINVVWIVVMLLLTTNIAYEARDST